jgi:hypothetical protein
MIGPDEPAAVEAFAASRERFENVLAWLEGRQAGGLEHSELEAQLQADARELFRQMFQDHLDLRATREQRIEAVADADQVIHPSAEPGHARGLTTVFGQVRVTRIAYRARGRINLHPADGELNLPAEEYSHGLRCLAAVESSRGSFEGAVEAIERGTGQRVGKRQIEQLARRSAIDADGFYRQRQPPASSSSDPLVLSCDGKGVVMRHDALRAATAAAAAKTRPKLATRLSKGEKRNRKRMAEVGTVFDATAARRASADILPADDTERAHARPGPVTSNKWLTASVVADAASVVAQIFAEADRRDPDHDRTWVALVDGNNHQIDRITAEAHARAVPITIVIDFIHVLEYIWKAAWCFHHEGDPAAEEWVRHQARAVLDGKATRVAGAIRRAATIAGLHDAQRAGADACAVYLTNKARYLDYPTALASGWPIATGVIEGACRHLVKDRMDLTGARWGLPGAEAILKLRAIRSNGDFDDYWHYHLTQEHHRVHESRYAQDVIPQAA